MSVYLTSSNGSLGQTPNLLTNLPKCNEVPTQSNQLVNKAYVDSNSGSGLVINQINLNDYTNSLNLATRNINVDLSSNTLNYLTNNIDINQFISLSSGFASGSVNALTFDLSGNLYAGGSFTTAGGVSAKRVAKWNGTNWSSLGSGINENAVNALAVDLSGNLYAGGNFTTAIAKWDGAIWTNLGSGIPGGAVGALVVDLPGNLYVGGGFGTAGGVTVNRIAGWNGSTWYALGSGITGSGFVYVYALAFDLSGNLYAGGDFTIAGGISANRIAKWNGTNWSALGSGMNNTVNALAVDLSGNLYAGGSFTTAGGISANRIAKWNGTTWYALVSGMNSDVNALTFDLSDNLYAGGFFTNAGGVPANRVAKIDFGQYDIWSINTYVNNKYLYDLLISQTINVNITNQGVAYTNGLVI